MANGTDAVVRAAARRARLLDPILLLLVGVGLAVVPGVPPYRLDPELVLVAVLPLLLYGTAFNTSLPTFRTNPRSIVLLSVGLTLFTTVVVGYTAHAVIPGLSLAAGMVLGALVAPPDAVARVWWADMSACPGRSWPCSKARACSTTPPR